MKINELTLEVGQRCLMKCIYCSSCSSPETVENQIPYSRIIDLLEEAKQIGVKHINLSGGEPFLHPQILSIITKIKEMGFTLHIYSSGVYTNVQCEVVPEQFYIPVPKEYIKVCKMLSVEKIIFNMQTNTDETYRSITNLSETTQAIRDQTIINCINEGIDIEINVVPMKINLDDIRAIAKKALGLGCKKINLLGLVMQGRCFYNRSSIIMNDEDNHKLNHILITLKDEYGEKIRIGNPLSGNSSTKCYAGIGRLTIRYDGLVFPCEAWKHKEFDDKNLKPLSIYDYDLENILKDSKFLSTIKEFTFSCKDANCADCPAQKELGYKCAYSENEPKVLPSIVALEAQSSKGIFDKHMAGVLKNSFEDFMIEYIPLENISSEIKYKFINHNYLYLYPELLDGCKYSHVISNKENKNIKAFVPEAIPVSQMYFDKFAKGEIPNFRTEAFIIDLSDPYAKLFPEPMINDMIPDKLKKEYYMAYLETALIPLKNKENISIAISLTSEYSAILEETGFKKIYENNMYAMYGYKIAKQFSTENIL